MTTQSRFFKGFCLLWVFICYIWVVKLKGTSFMTNTQMTLGEYSNKYKVSVSTLRRRIKKQNIEFKFDHGKYFIIDKPLHEHALPPRKVTQKDLAPPQTFNLSQELSDISNIKSQESVKSSEEKSSELIKTSEKLSEASFAETANRLLEELKKAYMLILSEKEEQVLYLKEEISDLKTLVRVLESENKDLKVNQTPQITHFPEFDV